MVNIYPDMGQVLPGLRLLDGRYLFAGLLANLFGIISIFFVTRPFLAAAMIVSGWFTVGGFMKKGSLNSTTAEGLLLGNFPIWTFGFWSIPLSLDDYYRTSRFAKSNNSSAHQPRVQVHRTPSI